MAQELIRKPPKPGYVLFDGPVAPEGSKFCVACMMLARWAAMNENKAAIEEHEKNGEGKILHLPLDFPGAPPVELATHQAVSGLLPQYGMIDVCWTHTGALAILQPDAVQTGRLAVGQVGLPNGQLG